MLHSILAKLLVSSFIKAIPKSVDTQIKGILLAAPIYFLYLIIFNLFFFISIEVAGQCNIIKRKII